MAGRRVLLCTFGFAAAKALEAIRRLPHDQLILVAGQDALGSPGYLTVKRLADAGPTPLETIVVDPFSFEDCYGRVDGALRRHLARGDRVTVNISGGTKLLADCALLAAYHHGVEAYHCEGASLRLPIIRGLSLARRVGEAERAVAKALRDGEGLSELQARLAGEGFGPAHVRAAIRNLQRMGLIGLRLAGGSIRIHWAPGQRFVREAIPAPMGPRAPPGDGGERRGRRGAQRGVAGGGRGGRPGANRDRNPRKHLGRQAPGHQSNGPE